MWNWLSNNLGAILQISIFAIAIGGGVFGAVVRQIREQREIKRVQAARAHAREEALRTGRLVVDEGDEAQSMSALARPGPARPGPTQSGQTRSSQTAFEQSSPAQASVSLQEVAARRQAELAARRAAIAERLRQSQMAAARGQSPATSGGGRVAGGSRPAPPTGRPGSGFDPRSGQRPAPARSAAPARSTQPPAPHRPTVPSPSEPAAGRNTGREGARSAETRARNERTATDDRLAGRPPSTPPIAAPASPLGDVWSRPRSGSRRARSSSRAVLGTLRGDDLRRAVLLTEILGPPMSARPSQQAIQES